MREEIFDPSFFLMLENPKKICVRCGKEIPPLIVDTGIPPQMCPECWTRFLLDLEREVVS